MSGGSKRHPISIQSQIDAIKKHKIEIQRLRGVLYKIATLEYFFQGAQVGAAMMQEIAKEALNTKKTIHLHHTSNEAIHNGSRKDYSLS
jgi:hypothetical protein